MPKISVYNISLPEYKVNSKPDFEKIGAKIDKVLIKHFIGQDIVIRCISSREHPRKSVDDLIKLILSIGTDRYNPKRNGDRYENAENKQIDIFALDYKIKTNKHYLVNFLEPFYTWPLGLGQKPIKIDLIIIYDRQKLKRVLHKYHGRDDVKRDGFVFKNPSNKLGALKGIIKIK